MSAYGTLDEAIAGLQFGLNPQNESGVAQEDIPLGGAVMGYPGDFNKVYAPHQDKVNTLLDGDLVASNVLTTTINGTAIATTYATSHAASMTAHIAAINANSTLAAAGIGAVANGARGIDITAKGLDLTVTQAVTAGASQANATVTVSTWAKFLGVAGFTQLGGRDYGAGSAKYNKYDAVNIGRYAETFVVAAAAVKSGEAAYVIYLAGADQGKFTNVSTNNYDINGTFRRDRNSQNLALLETRGIK